MIDKMMIRGAKVHNLENIDVDVSLGKQASKASVDKVLYVPAALALHQRPAVKKHILYKQRNPIRREDLILPTTICCPVGLFFLNRFQFVEKR